MQASGCIQYCMLSSRAQLNKQNHSYAAQWLLFCVAVPCEASSHAIKPQDRHSAALPLLSASRCEFMLIVFALKALLRLVPML